MLLDGVNHVAILTNDTDRLHAFYREVFDATVSQDLDIEPGMRLSMIDVGPHSELNVFQIEGTIMLVVALVVMAVKIFALVTALMFSPEHYRAADKLTKQAWVAILGLGVVAAILMPYSPLGLLNLAFLIAAFVYLADVRPALAGLTRR